jgi:hypothetical protein
MPRMPEAEWVGPYHDNGLMSRYDIVCIHTIVGNPPAHAAHFSTRSDGHIYQSRDTTFASAANYNGNYRVIAIENDDTGTPFPDWDHNDGHQVPPFTAEQIEAIAFVCAWAHQVHDIPLEQCPDSRSGSRGIAYHRQGIDGNFYAEGYAYGGRLTGGEVWTLSPGKACPGDQRISQMPQIIHRARQIAGLEPDEEDWFMSNIRLAKWSGAPDVFVVTPLGHWKLGSMQDANDFAYKYGLPTTNGVAVVESNNNVGWFGPNITSLLANAQGAKENAQAGLGVSQTCSSKLDSLAGKVDTVVTNTTPPPA